MTHRLTRWRFWLVISAALLISGCSPPPTPPSKASVPRMTLSQARKMFIKSAYASANVTKVRFEDQGAQVTMVANWGGESRSCSFPTSKLANASRIFGCISCYRLYMPGCNFYLDWDSQNEQDVVKFANAAYVLSHGAGEATQQEAAAFAETADQYRSAAVKPPLPEDARAYMVQASGALNEHRDDDAIASYQKALEVAMDSRCPLQSCRGNATQGDYGNAIAEMKKYLMLVPQAPDARAAQDQIYVWQSREQIGH
jgi:hypothetical protein